MLPIWLVYLLLILLVAMDILLVVIVAATGIFLVAYIIFNAATAFIGKKIDRHVREKLDQRKAARVKTGYSILYTLYRIYDLATGIVVVLVAFVLLALGMAGLALVNILLLWLLNSYVF